MEWWIWAIIAFFSFLFLLGLVGVRMNRPTSGKIEWWWDKEYKGRISVKNN